jgi:hypothetical protein
MPSHEPEEEKTEPTRPNPPRRAGLVARYAVFARVTASAEGRDEVTVGALAV